jgi:ABC-2 type transport system ATP-binding protein
LVSFQHVHKTYEGHQALVDVTFNIPKGKIFGLLGPNGAGKTTLLRMLVRILLPDNGNVFIDNQPLSDIHLPRIGYLPEERGLYPKMRVDDHLLFLARLKGLKKPLIKERIAFWSDKLQITDLLERKVEELSKGQQQKVQLIASVLHEPDLLILDEPFSGFDPVNAELLKQIILDMKSSGKTLLISTHRMENAEELCDEIAMLHQGKLVLNGVLKDVLNQTGQNRYRVCSSHTLTFNDVFDVLESSENEAVIQTKTLIQPNELLQKLMLQTQVEAFVPERKSLREVFLEKAK